MRCRRPPKTGWQKIFPRSDAQTDYDYGATRIDPSLNGVLTLIAFAWPLGLALAGRGSAESDARGFFTCSSFCFAPGTIWFIYAITEGGTRLWGAYFVFALTSAYALAALRDFFGSLLGGRSGSRSASATSEPRSGPSG